MKVFIATPAYDGKVEATCTASLIEGMRFLTDKGIPCTWRYLAGCCYLPIARNKLVRQFLASDCTDFVFVDADVGFEVGGLYKILQHDREIVGGAYPFKTDREDYPVQIFTDAAGFPLVDPETGLIQAKGLPTGFMRIKREVFERMASPELEVVEYDSQFKARESYQAFFDTKKLGTYWWGEDYLFCKMWSDMGGKLWLAPNITFTHSGGQMWAGNYHDWLRRQPGGGGEKPADWKF